jgi:hypothetical protein
MTTILEKKSKLTNNEKIIIKHLKKLEEINKYLNNIERISFDNSEEMKNYLLKVIISMKNEINLIKKFLKK